MSSRLIVNIRQLVGTREQSHLLRGAELAELPVIENAWLLIEDGEIAGYGAMGEMPVSVAAQAARHQTSATVADTSGPVIDAKGRFVLPAWCDSHTHLVYAGSREAEFADKIKGL